MSNRLKSACLTIIATGSCGRLRNVTILVDCVQGNKLCPRPFYPLDPKDLFHKTPLLKSHLCTVSSYKKGIVRPTHDTNNKKQNSDQTDAYQTGAIYLKFCPQACTPNR